jgi:hypothetical protein
MFSRKESFSNRLFFNKSSFSIIIKQLELGGFNNISVKVPLDYKNFDKHEFSIDEFLSLEYNFIAQILIAKSATDTLKILFVNNSGPQTKFKDKTFPSSHSELSKFYVQSNDPVRILGLADFIKTTLKDASIRSSSVAYWHSFLMSVAVGYFFLFSILFIDIFNSDPGPFRPFFLDNILLLSFLLLISVAFIFFYVVSPVGLYLNKFEHPLLSFAKRIFAGDWKNNPIVNFFILIGKLLLAGLFVNVVWYFTQDVIINAVNFLLTLIK